MPLVGGFSRESPVSLAHSFRRCYLLTSITLMGSQGLAVKGRQNIFPRSFCLLSISCWNLILRCCPDVQPSKETIISVCQGSEATLSRSQVACRQKPGGGGIAVRDEWIRATPCDPPPHYGATPQVINGLVRCAARLPAVIYNTRVLFQGCRRGASWYTRDGVEYTPSPSALSTPATLHTLGQPHPALGTSTPRRELSCMHEYLGLQATDQPDTRCWTIRKSAEENKLFPAGLEGAGRRKINSWFAPRNSPKPSGRDDSRQGVLCRPGEGVAGAMVRPHPWSSGSRLTRVPQTLICYRNDTCVVRLGAVVDPHMPPE
ncbi:hypothetical protein PR048_022689 [Dryococelus australis]|uniref:Uncharacterized protein n=1 Tax=Dryococelus australis TaxID=614101 RepID=A0ABQ9GS25_9NEOP|nr:hypothetical protein PR048_022689 [Dryococelus australis]